MTHFIYANGLTLNDVEDTNNICAVAKKIVQVVAASALIPGICRSQLSLCFITFFPQRSNFLLRI